MINFTLIAILGCVGIFFGVLLFAYLGYRFGKWQSSRGETSTEGSGALTGAIFGLLGLMIALTFNGAFSRLEVRRQLIVQETNAIGTAYLRLDLLPENFQTSLRENFQEYLASRVAFYEVMTDIEATTREVNRATELQDMIWDKAVAATQGTENQAARMLLIPSLNEMIDIVTTRSIAIQTHSPFMIWVVLTLLVLACAGIVGYSSSHVEHPRYIYLIVFAIVTIFTMYIIFDVEYPRYGIIRLDQTNQLLVDLLRNIK